MASEDSDLNLRLAHVSKGTLSDVAAQRNFNILLTIFLLNTTCPVLTNSVDPDQLASNPTDLDLHYLSLNM